MKTVLGGPTRTVFEEDGTAVHLGENLAGLDVSTAKTAASILAQSERKKKMGV